MQEGIEITTGTVDGLAEILLFDELDTPGALK